VKIEMGVAKARESFLNEVDRRKYHAKTAVEEIE
jgi:hypothetical protein